MVDPQTSIFPFGIRIDEPVATITDLLVTVVCTYAYVQMRRMGLNDWSQIHFRRYFLLVAIATAWGGIIGHGFLYAFTFAWKLPGWIVGIVSVALVERSAISHAQALIQPKIGKFFLIFNIIEMCAILAITMISLDFKWVQYHNAYGLLINVAGFHGYAYYRTRDKGSLIILGAVVVTSVASVVFTNEISLHTWFNYIDISHVLLAVAAYIMYLGAIRQKTTKVEASSHKQPIRKTERTPVER
ncbi:hypothetical protein WBG78_22130 [Chryseolinea sp. T2]|uniref:DUF6962 family protein n=1 Tax=Chryseolinea sp. T2 TaxID=3129255 RepID=UPI00307824BE